MVAIFNPGSLQETTGLSINDSVSEKSDEIEITPPPMFTPSSKVHLCSTIMPSSSRKISGSLSGVIA